MNLTMQELELFKMPSGQLFEYLKKQLKGNGYKTVEGKTFVYSTGKIPVLMVAHIDTVHRQPIKTLLYDKEQGLLWSPEGLGADDRAGVLGILRILKQGLRPHVLFTDLEEAGGVGADAATLELRSIGAHYIIELDRRNSNDAVFYGCENKAFKTFVESFGFKEATGSFSDISILCPAWDIAGVNLSTGHYNEHTKSEYLCLTELGYTLKRVVQMLLTPVHKKYRYEGKPRVVTKVPAKAVTSWAQYFKNKDYTSDYNDKDTKAKKMMFASLYDDNVYASYSSSYSSSYDVKDYGKYSSYSKKQELPPISETVIKLYLEPDFIADLYGGTAAYWADWLHQMQDELFLLAEKAVYAEIQDQSDELTKS